MAERILLELEEEDELIWEVGGIYKYLNPKIHPTVNHRFVLCVKLEGNRGVFVYCTSQEGTMNHLVATLGYDEVTLPYIVPNGHGVGNYFTKDTFVNCNEPLDECLTELTWMHEDGELERVGTVSYGDFDQIRNGMFKSSLVPNVYPKSMRYPGIED